MNCSVNLINWLLLVYSELEIPPRHLSEGFFNYKLLTYPQQYSTTFCKTHAAIWFWTFPSQDFSFMIGSLKSWYQIYTPLRCNPPLPPATPTPYPWNGYPPIAGLSADEVFLPEARFICSKIALILAAIKSTSVVDFNMSSAVPPSFQVRRFRGGRSPCHGFGLCVRMRRALFLPRV